MLIFRITFLLVLMTINLSWGFECPYPWLDCGNGKCFPEGWRCDGDDDCGNLRDEQNCGDPCGSMACSQNCRNTSTGAQCYCNDGYVLDAKDEKTCNDIDECQQDHVCIHGCINTVGSYICSCPDGYELVNKTCEAKVPGNCTTDEVSCMDGKCIQMDWLCDGEADCLDSSDETNCNETRCNSEQFRCGNGQCVPASFLCDGTEECDDGSDEKNCTDMVCGPGKVLCPSTVRCIRREWICDGDSDCFDGSDEENCNETSSPPPTLSVTTGGTCETTTCSQNCKNTPSGPRCYCNDGYVLDAKDNKTCDDIDECQQEHFCSHGCINTVGSYNCSCPDGYELVNRTCEVKSPDPLLIFSTIKEIRGINLRSNQDFSVRRTITQASTVDVDPKNERIYWVEISSRTTVYSAKPDGSDFRPILSHGLLVPEDIAVDYIANNLYITDSGLRQVLACKTFGTMCHVLHDTNVEKPHSIVLDADDGLVYWSDWGEQSVGIYKSGMDGSRRNSLVSSHISRPNGIVIDHTSSKLYWADSKLDTIEFITLNGSLRKVILRSSELQPYSLAMFEDQIYWADWTTSSLVSCNKLACHNMTTLALENSDIGRMQVYYPALTAQVPNPCLNSNCSHMCLISPVKGFSCACPYWLKLSTDGRTCTDKEDGELIFVSDGPTILIRHKVDGERSSNLFPLSLDNAMITGISYDSKAQRLFVADANKPAIYAINMTSLSVLDLVINCISPEDLAFDWMSSNLYWVDSELGSVEVISVDSLKRITLIKDLMRPMSLAISPPCGNMFVATPYNEASVAMYGMDGKMKRILRSVRGLPISLTHHPSKSFLYWADPRAGMISYVNYTSPSFPWILKTGVDGVMSVAASEEYIYWTAREKDSYEIPERVHAFHLSGQDNGIVQRRVAYSPRKVPSGKSECLIKNGGCSYLCLTSPNGRTCACSSAMILTEDSLSCIGKKCDENDFKCGDGQCIPDELRCDGSKDCNDGSDEVDCDSNEGCGSGLFRCKEGACVYNYQLCDGISDCSSGEDELNCPVA